MAQIKNNKQQQIANSSKTFFCWGYEEDLKQAYAFYSARYDNISYEEFLHLKITDTAIKISSIPKDEPLYEIIKARTIDTSKIKDKDQKDYWNELKELHKIPQIFLSTKEVDEILKTAINGYKIGGLK